MLSAIMRLQNSNSDAMAPAFFWAYDEMSEGEEKKGVKDLMTVQSFSLLTAEHLLKHGMMNYRPGKPGGFLLHSSRLTYAPPPVFANG